jgi:hypothetical protein
MKSIILFLLAIFPFNIHASESMQNRVVITNKDEFAQHTKKLKIDTVSQVLEGVSKESFHGFDVQQLCSNIEIDQETLLEKEGEALTASIMVADGFKIFGVIKEAWNENGNDIAFLDISTTKVVDTMISKGFGKPKISDERRIWEWKLNDLECSFEYNDNPFNPIKSIKYLCSSL